MHCNLFIYNIQETLCIKTTIYFLTLKRYLTTYWIIKLTHVFYFWKYHIVKLWKCPMCVFKITYHQGWGLKSVLWFQWGRKGDNTSWRQTSRPSEVDTCTPSSVGFIARLWLGHVSLVQWWRDQAANRALYSTRVSVLICGALAPRTLNVKRAIRLPSRQTADSKRLLVLDSLELKDIWLFRLHTNKQPETIIYF